MTPLDWILVAAYFAVALGIGLAMARRAGRSISEFFIGGRALPWWLAGTSMVATTFAADTPLAVSEMVAQHGVAGNWLWWSMVMSGILTVFFYARLWRRAGVLTDVEFTEIRYGGRPAAFLRGFRALYLALPINLIIIGWVNLAMVEIMRVVLDVPAWTALLLCFVLAAGYAILSGLWGVVLTDFLQFGLAVGGAVLLAWFAVEAVGGMDSLVEGVSLRFGSEEAALSLVPRGDAAFLPGLTLAVYLGVNWWASWYPGAEPGGGGYVAQRIFSCRTERDGVLATLWFNLAHYAVRPWPWILVALASLLLYPDLTNPREGYVRAVVDLLPPGVTGLVVAGFAAAYMSTVSTQLNWGASYLVNDVWARFVRPEAQERELVRVSRWATLLLMLASLVVTLYLDSIEGAWRFLLALGAGTGLVLILRWYWWRINAWSEISAMAASFVLSLVLWNLVGLDPGDLRDWAVIMLWTVAGSTVVWTVVTVLTGPERREVLHGFYRRVRPGGPGWRRVSEELGYGAEPIPDGPMSGLNWVAGVVSVYATLFGTGRLLFGDLLEGLLWLGAAALCFVWIGTHFPGDTPPEPARRPPPAR